MIPWSCRDKVNFKIYDVITLTNNYNTHIVHYPQIIQDALRPCFWITGTSHFAMWAGVSFYFIWILYEYRWRSFLGFFAMKHMNRKTQLSATSLDGLLWTLSNIFFHYVQTGKSSCTQLPVRFGVSGFLLSLFTDPVA